MKRVAIPVSNGLLSQHFGHCDHFALYDTENNEVKKRVLLDAPPHQPGLLPKWLADKGATDILAGGMGQRAISLFQKAGVNVYVGVPGKTADRLVEDFLAGKLVTNENLCDH
ncbi:MAG: NifB/NifX family molybdenum-iron cluster-binding protein [Bacteroidales bacterium]